jgi:transposase
MTPQRGGRWRDHRQVLNGILFRVRTGIPWRDLPERYGPWETVSKRFARWQTDRTWARIEATLRTQADAAGELDWDAQIDSSVIRAHQHAAGARNRGARRSRQPPASAGAVTGRADHQAAHHLRRPGPQPGHPPDPGPGRRHERAGRAGGSGAGGPPRWAGAASHPGGACDRGQGLQQPGQPAGPAGSPDPPHDPQRDDQKANRARKGRRGGRPPGFDRERYRQRNQVERLMNRRKQFRAVATRFDQLAVRYQATVCVADIFIWLRARPDRARGDPRNRP